MALILFNGASIDGIIFYTTIVCMVVVGCLGDPGTEHGFWRPDFVSAWLPLVAQGGDQSVQTVPHGLGEVPLLVDVQAKSTCPNYGDIIYPGIGASPRDDDLQFNFGAVTYIYNAVHVLVMAPVQLNGHAAGAAVYTGNGVDHKGPHQQLSNNVLVRVRAWRSRSLLEPEFSLTGINVTSNTTDVNKLYVERSHALGEYPAFVRVRTTLTFQREEWISDAVGASLQVHDPTSTDISARFVVYGFNDSVVRVWIPNTGRIFDSADSCQIFKWATTGFLEIFAWKARSVMRPKFTYRFPIGPSVENEQLEQNVAPDMTSHTSYVSVWVESLSGRNKGFRFPGSGSLSYDTTVRDSICTYGGLTYGFTSGTIKVWRPTGRSNSGVICIAGAMGSGINSQLALDANVVLHWWDATVLKQTGLNDDTDTCSYVNRL